MSPPWHSRDARLVVRARGGDARAFEQIYVRYAPVLLSFCRHLTGQREDAEDAVQHTFMAAHNRIAGSDEPLNLRPWLFTVARNRSLSLLRMRNGGREAAVDTVAVAIDDGLVAEVERREDLRQLVRDLGRLPEPQRAALLLSQLDALPYREIAHVLGVEPEKVKALVFQARSSLASTREAREAPCTDIRSQIATAHGPSLRRRTLRRHVRDCAGCRDFETTILRQRSELDVLLPVAPSVGLAEAIAEIAGRGGDVGSAGAAVGSTAGGGVAGGGIGGSLATIGGSGIAKLAMLGAIVGGTTGGAVAADLPDRLHAGSPLERVDPGPLRESPRAHGGDSPAGAISPAAPRAGKPLMDERRESRQELVDAPVRAVPAPADPGDGAGAPSEQTTDPAAAPARPDGGLPPGLAKKDELPPGLAKKEAGAPSGQAKQGGAPSGQQKAASPPGQDEKEHQAASPPGQEKKEDGDTGGPGSPGNSHGNGKAKGR